MKDPSDTRLLIVAPGVPHDSRGASTVLFYHYIDRFRRTGFRILNLLLLQPDNSSDERLAAYTSKMADGDRFEVLPCRAPTFILPRDHFGFSLDVEALRPVLPRAEAFGPEGIVCFDLLSAWVGNQVGGRARVAWLGDLNFETDWYHALYVARERWAQVRRLPIVWMQRRAWRRIYRDVLERMDAVIVSADGSRRHLARLGIASVYRPYPWPNRDGEPHTGGAAPSGLPAFLFLGTLTGLGSRSAFHYMLKALYPRLVALWGHRGFRILIAGTRGLPPWVGQALDGRPEFEYLGFVDDLDAVMASCHAVLAPIDVPIGNRSRIVTAMAKGALVIAHTNAALGNPDLVDGVTCFLVGDADTFVARMRRAVERRDEAARIVANAQECYRCRFEPEVATAAFLDETLRAMAAKGIVAPLQPTSKGERV